MYNENDYPLWVWQHVAPSGVVLSSGISYTKIEPSNHIFPLDAEAKVWAKCLVWMINKENEKK